MRKDEIIVYKVTMNGKSCFSPYIEDKYRLSYGIGEITIPKIGKIFAFKDIDSARYFANEQEPYYVGIIELFKCIGVPSRAKPLIIQFADDLVCFFRKKALNSKRIQAPMGTIMMNYIIPIRKERI